MAGSMAASVRTNSCGRFLPLTQTRLGSRQHRCQPSGAQPQRRLGTAVGAGDLDRDRLLRRVLGVTDTHRRRPLRVRNTSGGLCDRGHRRHVHRDVSRLRVVEGPSTLPVRAHPRDPLAAVPARDRIGRGSHLVRPRPAQLPAGRDGQVHHAAHACDVPGRGTQ